MSVEFYRESPEKFDSRTLNRKTLTRWTGRTIVSHSHSLTSLALKSALAGVILRPYQDYVKTI